MRLNIGKDGEKKDSNDYVFLLQTYLPFALQVAWFTFGQIATIKTRKSTPSTSVVGDKKRLYKFEQFWFAGGGTGEGKFSVPIDMIFPHSTDNIVIAFGSTIEAGEFGLFRKHQSAKVFYGKIYNKISLVPLFLFR